MGSKPKAADVARELARPTSLPAYRAVYGHTRVPGTLAPWQVKGRILYGCLILNSRPSHGNFSIYVDKRLQTVSAGIYDFGPSGGARSTNYPLGDIFEHARFWIGRGDQTQPPQQILDEAPEFFSASDAWRGLTVIWLRLDTGNPETISRRWPSAPPNIEVEGDWSLVKDPRSPGAPAAYSANQVLCALDALRSNPVRAYPDEHLLMETWIAGADLADEMVARKDGSLEPRYRVGGVLVWSDAEVEDQVDPLVAAGAGRLMRVGGRLGYVPGCWIEPSETIGEVLEDGGLDYQRWAPGDDLPTSVTATYTSPTRNWEDADLGAWSIPGALAADGGIDKPMTLDLLMITSPTQAMRVQSIEGRRARMQRRIQCVVPGAYFDLIGGSCAQVDLPPPYSSLNGTYTVASIHPGLDPLGSEGDGVAMRCPIVLTETDESIYAWNPDEDEDDVPVGVDVDPDTDEVPMPGALSLSSAVVGRQPALRFSFDPADSALITHYQWEWRADGRARVTLRRVAGALRVSPRRPERTGHVRPL